MELRSKIFRRVIVRVGIASITISLMMAVNY